MRVDTNSTTTSAIGPDRAEDLRARIQLQLLRKQLDIQKANAAELLATSAGKGQTLDIRV